MHGCRGGVRGCRGVCVVAGGACVVARGVCLVKGGVRGEGGAMHSKGGHAWDTTIYGDTINERAVRILLECILVIFSDILVKIQGILSAPKRGDMSSPFLSNDFVVQQV